MQIQKHFPKRGGIQALRGRELISSSESCSPEFLKASHRASLPPCTWYASYRRREVCEGRDTGSQALVLHHSASLLGWERKGMWGRQPLVSKHTHSRVWEATEQGTAGKR